MTSHVKKSTDINCMDWCSTLSNVKTWEQQSLYCHSTENDNWTHIYIHTHKRSINRGYSLRGILTHSSDAALAVYSPPHSYNTCMPPAHSLCVNLIYRTNLAVCRPCSPGHCCRLVTSDKGEQRSHTLCSLVWLVVLACSVARWSTNEQTGSWMLTWAFS